MYLPAVVTLFLTLSEEANYVYMVDDYWEAGKEVGVLATDPDLKIEWFFDKLNLSDKDQKNQTVRELFPNQFLA